MRKRILIIGLVAAAGSMLAWAAEEAAVVYKDPRYEDDPTAWIDNPKPDAWNRYKFISLDEPTHTWLSLGGQARVRGEYWENFAFNDAKDDGFVLGRLRLHGDLIMGQRLRAFVEGRTAVSTHRSLPGGRRLTDEDRLDLLNAFVDVNGEVADTTLTLRSGRQELSFGKQRVVSPLDWVNTRRTFDGARVIAERGPWRVDALWARLVAVEKHDFNNEDSGADFFGWYASRMLPEQKAVLDLYWLVADNDRAVFNGVTGDELRYTAGARLGGRCGDSGFDYDLEAGYQYGEVGSADVQAWSWASQIGWSPEDCPAHSRVYVGYDYASGDDDPADDEVGTFNQLYPLGHAYLGYIDLIGRQNIQAFSVGVSAEPCRFAKIRIDAHHFERAETADAVYNAGGGVVRAGDAGSSREVGRELDLTLICPLDQHTTAQFGISRFWAGDFIEESGASEDVDFAYAQVQYTF